MRYTFRVLAHRIRQPQPRPSKMSMFVLRRDSDGKVWAGPYKWTGATFTDQRKFWWGTATVAAMQARVNDEGLTGCTITQVPR